MYTFYTQRTLQTSTPLAYGYWTSNGNELMNGTFFNNFNVMQSRSKSFKFVRLNYQFQPLKLPSHHF